MRRQGFTLIELLVVISIIALLIGILLPALGATRFTSRVMVCLSNNRQWGIALTAYATDAKGWLPTANFNAAGENLWDVHPDFPKQILTYGGYWSMFFCPTRPDEYQKFGVLGRAVTYNIQSDQALLLGLELRRQAVGGQFTTLDTSFWIPRSNTRGASVLLYFPTPPGDPRNTVTRDSLTDRGVREDYARRIDDKSAERPIHSDALWKLEDSNLAGTSGGHPRANGIDSTNLTFLDGHAETRSADRIEPRYQFGASYNFY